MLLKHTQNRQHGAETLFRVLRQVAEVMAIAQHVRGSLHEVKLAAEKRAASANGTRPRAARPWAGAG
jgi:hypothetical protein